MRRRRKKRIKKKGQEESSSFCEISIHRLSTAITEYKSIKASRSKIQIVSSSALRWQRQSTLLAYYVRRDQSCLFPSRQKVLYSLSLSLFCENTRAALFVSLRWIFTPIHAHLTVASATSQSLSFSNTHYYALCLFFLYFFVENKNKNWAPFHWLETSNAVYPTLFIPPRYRIQV